MSHVSNSPAGSIGRVIHFVYHYLGLRIAETATYGEEGVHYYGKKIAEILEWKDIEVHGITVNVPIFKFISKYGYGNREQYTKQRMAIIDLTEFREKIGDMSKLVEIHKVENEKAVDLNNNESDMCDCGKEKRHFMHNCDGVSQYEEFYGCPSCDDICEFCENTTVEDHSIGL